MYPPICAVMGGLTACFELLVYILVGVSPDDSTQLESSFVVVFVEIDSDETEWLTDNVGALPCPQRHGRSPVTTVPGAPIRGDCIDLLGEQGSPPGLFERNGAPRLVKHRSIRRCTLGKHVEDFLLGTER
jgi:hypothetical protein